MIFSLIKVEGRDFCISKTEKVVEIVASRWNRILESEEFIPLSGL
jgi:hypothetical protein